MGEVLKRAKSALEHWAAGHLPINEANPSAYLTAAIGDMAAGAALHLTGNIKLLYGAISAGFLSKYLSTEAYLLYCRLHKSQK